MKTRLRVGIVAASFLSMALAGCLQTDDSPHQSGMVIVKIPMDRTDPQTQQEIRNKSVHVDPAHANERVPFLVDALRRAQAGSIEGIGEREQEEAVIAYLEELSGGKYLPPVEFEGAYFSIDIVTE